MKSIITMKDIADELDITVMSVSKALSGKEGVSEDLRARILAKAEELGYKKPTPGNNISSNNIGILISERRMNSTASYMSLQQLLISNLTQSNYFAITEIISDEVEHLLLLPKIIKDNKVSAFIIIGELETSYINLLKETKLPYVFINNTNKTGTEEGISSDDLYSGYTLANYLIEKGCHSIGFVGNRLLSEVVMDRYLGILKAMLKSRLSLPEEYVIQDVDEYGEEQGLFLPENVPDAFICNDCRVAYKLIHQLEGMEYDVPKDVSVAAFDDGVFADIGIPKLTTYSVDYEKMAIMAAESIILKLESQGYHSGRKVVLGKVIERDSVKK